MKYRCPACNAKNKAKKSTLLEGKPEAACAQCGQRVYLAQWGVVDMIIGFLSEVSTLIFIFGFLGTGVFLPNAWSTVEKIVACLVITFILLVIYAYLLGFLRGKASKVSCYILPDSN